jgi:hypothetical protein
MNVPGSVDRDNSIVRQATTAIGTISPYYACEISILFEDFYHGKVGSVVLTISSRSFMIWNLFELLHANQDFRLRISIENLSECTDQST